MRCPNGERFGFAVILIMQFIFITADTPFVRYDTTSDEADILYQNSDTVNIMYKLKKKPKITAINSMNQKQSIKSPYDYATLQHFRELLLNKRREAKEQIEVLENSIEELNDADDADNSSMAHHMGDVGSEVEHKEINYQLLERTRKYIGQIDAALERIENGTYGICQATDKPIPLGRLEAVPHTRFSIEAKQQGQVEEL